MREEKGFQLDFIVQDVKVTFFSGGAVLIPFKVKDYTCPFENLNIATISTIAALKMSAISQRSTMRDYYDLYFLAKHILPLPEIYALSKSLFPALSSIIYSETIVYTNDIPEETISGHLLPSEIITKYQIADFFVDEIRKMKL